MKGGGGVKVSQSSQWARDPKCPSCQAPLVWFEKSHGEGELTYAWIPADEAVGCTLAFLTIRYGVMACLFQLFLCKRFSTTQAKLYLPVLCSTENDVKTPLPAISNAKSHGIF
ncbi:hypothetical protein TNCV_1078961 [Trichonephila clavipes]|nr:hypothetical protein TNCV_1078961 [Trichonephila clavipes]